MAAQTKTDVAIPEIADYLTNAARLVACINDLQTDRSYVSSPPSNDKAPGQIVYLMDTNTVLFALRPREEAAQTNVFRHGDSKGNRDIAALTAWLIKSGQLAGQNSQPFYMARDHLAELSRIIELSSDAVRGAAKHYPVPETIVQKAQLLYDFSALRKKNLLHAFEGSQWSTATRGAQESPSNDNRELIEQITRVVLRAHANNQVSFSGPIERNIRSDARVILDVAAANRAHADSGQRFCLLTADRYLHVGVSSLFYSDDAFNKLCAGVDPVRHVLQLLPHYNLPMNDPIESAAQFKSTYEEMLDAFGYHKSRPHRGTLHFYAMAAFSDFHPQVWVWMNQIVARKNASAEDKTAADTGELEALLDVVNNGYEHWKRASEKTLEANRHLIESEQKEKVASLQQVRAQLSKILDDYEAEHFNLLLSYYCWTYFESIKRKTNKFASRDARIVLAITVNLGDLTEGNSVSSYIDSLNGDMPDDLVPEMIHRLKQADVSDRRLLIGCLALAAETSDANVKVAHDLFERVAKDHEKLLGGHGRKQNHLADLTHKEAVLEVDLNHLLSMTSRLRGQMELRVDSNEPHTDGPNWLEQARQHCDHCVRIAEARDMKMELLRARNQRAAINGTNVFNRLRQLRAKPQQRQTRPSSGDEPEQHAIAAAEAVSADLTACWRQLSSKPKRDKLVEQVSLSKQVDRNELLHKIEIQIYNNILAYSAMRGGAAIPFPSLERPMIDAAMAWMETFEDGKLVGQGAFSVELINYLAMCHVVGHKPLHGDTAGAALKDYLQRVEQQCLIEGRDGSEAKLSLHESDIAQLRFYASAAFLERAPGS